MAPSRRRSQRGRGGASSSSSSATSGGGDRRLSDAWRLAEAQREATSALRQAHDLASELLPSVAPLLPASLDVEARGSQLALTCLAWQKLQGRSAPEGAEADGGRATREVFSEENSEEVARLAPILESIAGRTRELLQQWPDHAGLLVLMQCCERLRTFRVGSPLMKFVTGAELLLKQCWAWEQVACRATSIKQQIDDLTRLVLRWRKMELHAWPRLLECAASQAHEKALSRVWVRLFRVVHAGAAGSVPEDDGGGGGGGARDDDDETAQDDETAAGGAAAEAADADAAAAANATPLAETDLAEHLREFYAAIESLMLSSSAGAWEAHLKLLTTFEAQLRVEGRLGSDGTADADEAVDEMEEAMEAAASAERRRRRAGYAAILHNVAAYYRQFTEKLRGAVTAQMGPIETKLTDFIKLGQWSDRNFAALKTSIEKSHVHLNRCVTAYKGLLDQPAAHLLSAGGKAHDEAEAAEDERHAALAAPPLAVMPPPPPPSSGGKARKGSKNKRAALDAAAAAAEEEDSETTAAVWLLDLGSAASTTPRAASSSSSEAASSPSLSSTSTLAALAKLVGPIETVGEVGEAFASGDGKPLQCGRLAALCARMRDFCRKVILSPGSAARSTARVGHVIELREAIVARASELRKLTDKKARQMKHKAVVDLLKGLQASGLSFHASAVDQRQMAMGKLFAVRTHAQFEVQAVFTGSLRLASGAGAAGGGDAGDAGEVTVADAHGGHGGHGGAGVSIRRHPRQRRGARRTLAARVGAQRGALLPLPLPPHPSSAGRRRGPSRSERARGAKGVGAARA